MKTFNVTCAQGELFFVRLSDDTPLPHSGKEIVMGGALIVGHSETGHHHVMTAEKSDLYRLPDNILQCLLVVHDPDGDDLIHLREFDRHETIHFPAGKYRVHRQREYVPEGFRAVED